MMPASSDVETPSRTPPRRKKGRRNFGTLLSANSPPPSSLKKKVKVKRSSSSRTPSTNIRTSPAAATTTAATTITSGESNDDLYTVTFEPGPIGLQIEPAGSGAVRVQRFVDGGPRAPGPARRTGLIQLGDLVTRVNKRPIVSYETTVQLLQQTGVRREMTLQRVSWNHHKQKKDPPRRLPGTLRKKQTPKGADKQSDSSDDSELRPISFVVDTLVTPHPQQDEENQGKADSSLSPDASLETASLHSVTPSITTMDRGPALSPSRIKEIVRNESSTKEAATFSPHKREKTRSSPSKSVLKTVYTSVVPTAGAVASGSLKVGSLLSTKLGEALVGHSSSEFDTTVQLKHELLNELSQAKATLHTQQETIQTLLRSQAQEKERLEQELDLSRREKLIAEQSLVQLQEQLHDTSPAQQAEYRDRIEELQRLLRDTEISRDKLDSHVQMLQDKLSRLNEEAANSNSPGELECLQEKNDELSDRLDMLVMQLAQKESKLTESRATIRELEAAHASMQREIEAAQASMQSELEAAQASMQREINQSSSETQDTLRRRDAKIQELTQEMTVLQHELSQKGTSTTATSVTLEQVATEKRHLASENARLNTRMDQVVQERARFKEQLELSERQLSDLKDAQATKLSNLQTTSSAQVERLQRELSLKEQNLSESNITIQRLRDDLARADREKEGLRDAAMGESKLRTELERTRTELKKVVESSRQAEREWKQTVEHWERENQTRRGSMVTQQSELREQSNQLEAITVKYEDVLGALKVAKLDLQQAQVQAATFKQEKEEAVKREKCIRAEAEERIQSIIQDASHKVEAEARGEISELKRHVKSLESSITLARRENESLHKLNTDLSSRVSKLHDSLDEKENNISAKRIEALEQNGQIEDLRDDLARKHEELDSCKSSLETAKDQYAMLNERLSHVSEEFSKDKRKMTTELIELRDHCAELESQNSDLERLLRSLRRTASESEARWTSTRQELLHEREALRELRVSSEQTRTKLEERMVVLKTDVSNYKELSAVSTDHVNELKSKNKSMSVEIDSLKQDCSDLKTLLQRRTSANLSDREALEAKLGTEREKVSKLSKKLALSDSEVHALKKGLGQQKQQFEQLIAKQAVESELRSKKQSEWLATKEAELKQLSVSVDQLRDAQSEAARLRDSLRRSRNEVEHLTDLLDTIREEHASREIELVETHKEESRRLETEKDELEASLRKSEEQRDALESCLFAAEEGLSAARTERENLITERKDLSTALHKAEDNLMELQGEFDNFRREHMDASTDSSKGELSDLSRGELKTRCSELLSHLEASERRATAAAEDASRRSTHVKRLAEDLDAMSGEIDKLLHSNELLDRFLQETRSDKVTAESEAASAKTKAELLAEEVDRIRRDLEEQRNKNATLTDSNQEIQFRLERENQEQKELQRKLEADSQRLLTLLSETQADKDATDGTVSRLRMELSGMIAEKEQSSRRLVELETLLEEQKTQLIEFEAQKDATREQYDADISRYETKSASLEDECASLRRRVSELEVAVETQTIDLRNKEETEKTKTAALEKYRQDRHETETKHQDAVSKLVEASRVVASQKDSIRALEHKAAEADKLVASMSEQIKNLQSTILKLESSSETNVGFRSKQLIDLKEKCAAIDEDRLALRQEVSVLRGELRQARKESMEYQSVNKTLLSRIDSLKTAVDATKTELREVRKAKEKSSSSSKALENEVDNKQMEVDHLKAKVQVLNATIARMKADHLLLQEASLRSEFKEVSVETTKEEVALLKSELRTKSAKLESLSEVYNSQQQALAVCQTAEEQLLLFIDDVIEEADSAFRKISDFSSTLCSFENGNLDGIDSSPRGQVTEDKLGAVLRSIDSLALVIPNALSFLSEKRHQLHLWKEKCSGRMTPILSTPSKRSRGIPDSPAVRDALEKVKSVLQNAELISPVKTKHSEAGPMDSEYLQNLIRSLEGQIDSLLADLQSANDALRKKDQLFANLERVISHSESERELVEHKYESMKGSFVEMEERLQKEISWKEAAEKELARLQGVSDEDEQMSSKQAAGRLIAKFLERRSYVSKSIAFRRWTCQTTAIRAVSQQGHAAAALAQQLETTREKLVILKRHLKKTRRGQHPSSSSLDRILEGYDEN